MIFILKEKNETSLQKNRIKCIIFSSDKREMRFKRNGCDRNRFLLI